MPDQLSKSQERCLKIIRNTHTRVRPAGLSSPVGENMTIGGDRPTPRTAPHLLQPITAVETPATAFNRAHLPHFVNEHGMRAALAVLRMGGAPTPLT